jgi:hypothetical protein
MITIRTIPPLYAMHLNLELADKHRQHNSCIYRLLLKTYFIAIVQIVTTNKIKLSSFKLYYRKLF